MRRIFVDVETTGLDHRVNGIHQIAAIVEREDGTTDELALSVKPFAGDVVEPEALKVGGVTAEQINTYTHPVEAHRQLCVFLGFHVDKFHKGDKLLFLAYNAHFDADFLRAWFGKCGDKYYGSWFWTPPIDIMSLAAHRLSAERARMANFKLATVASALGIAVDEDATHDALYDIRLAREVYRRSTHHG